MMDEDPLPFDDEIKWLPWSEWPLRDRTLYYADRYFMRTIILFMLLFTLFLSLMELIA